MASRYDGRCSYCSNNLASSTFVDDGVLCITNAESLEPKFDPSMLEVSPFLEKQEKAERGELPLSEMKELIEIMKLQKEIMKLKKEMVKIENAPTGGGGIGPSHQ